MFYNQGGNVCLNSEHTPAEKTFGSNNNSQILGMVTVNNEVRQYKQNLSCNGTTLPFGVRGFPRLGVTQQRPYLNPDIGDYTSVSPNMVQGMLNETVYRR
jgi:hypothetical protein